MSRWSDVLSKKHQLRGKTAKEKKPNKYLAKAPVAVGSAQAFPSHLEESVYADLLYQKKSGLLRDVERYPTVHLTARVKWKVDFKVFDVGLCEPVWVEAKGFEDLRYKLLKQLWPDLGPGLLRIYKGSGSRVWVSEEIRGKK